MTTLTRKGQVTVPKSIRDYLGLKAGSSVSFERLPSGDIALRPNKRTPQHRLSAFAKLRGRATVRMTTEQIMSLTRGE
jgi:antitoxin PrlF